MPVRNRQFLYTGNACYLTNGRLYNVNQISEATGIGVNAIRCRLQYCDEFGDDRLFAENSRGFTGGTKKPLNAIEHRARIVRNAVISETEYITAPDPVANKKIRRWIAAVLKNPDRFWIRLDDLLLSQIIKIAMNYKEESR